jgi:cation diffusion facilitator CzcD-associated flavoprotein CzcO
MLQRSPTYIVALPAVDAFARSLQRILPRAIAYKLTRLKNVVRGLFFFQLSRRIPAQVKRKLLEDVRAALGPEVDVDRHFTPSYNPWDQRICVVPDGDLFDAIRNGSASIVTDHIETFTERGIALRSGTELEADIIITATGLVLEVLGGLSLTVDGRAIDLSRQFAYKGMMFSDVPNLASSFGYTNASWTLKCDLTCSYVCRLLNHLDRVGLRQCTPRVRTTIDPQPWLDFSSGYVQRSIAKFPRQGTKRPWRAYQNYLLDLLAFKFAQVDDGAMEFSNPIPKSRQRVPASESRTAKAAPGAHPF